MKLSLGIRQDKTQEIDGITYRLAKQSDYKEITALHNRLFGTSIVSWLAWLYRFRLKELGSVAQDREGKIIAYDLFMFNDSEKKDGIIHEIYVGVIPSYQGRGISTKLRTFSLSTYEHGTLKGASTIAKHNDIRALRSAQKSGYAIVKESIKPVGHYLLKIFVHSIDYTSKGS